MNEELPKKEQPPKEREEEDDGVDMTLVRWFATLTPLERLRALERQIAAVEDRARLPLLRRVIEDDDT